MVRKNELACRDEWSRDLWEARSGATGTVAAPLAVPLPGGPLPPATDHDIAAILRADTVVSSIATNDIVLSELGGAPSPAPAAAWPRPTSRAVETAIEDSVPGAPATAEGHDAQPSQDEAWQHTEVFPQDYQPTSDSSRSPYNGGPESASIDHLLFNDTDAAIMDEPATAWRANSPTHDEPTEQADKIGDETEPAPRDSRGTMSEHPLQHAASDVLADYDDVDDNNIWREGPRPARRSGFRLANLLPWRQVSSASPGTPARGEFEDPTHASRLESSTSSARAGSSAGRHVDVRHVSARTDSFASSVEAVLPDPELVEPAVKPHSKETVSAAPPTDVRDEAGLEPEEVANSDGLVSLQDSLFGVAVDRPSSFAGDPAFATPSWFPDNAAVVTPGNQAAEPVEMDDDAEAQHPLTAVASSTPPAATLYLARTDAGPRLCRRCRDFRPAGDGGANGWCANQWAFPARHVVAGNDETPCAAAYGDWWVARDDIWFEAGDISAHGMSTPLLDAFVSSPYPDEGIRRRR